VFPEPPQTLNPPAVVVGPVSGQWATAALSVDETDVDVMCAAAIGHYNDLDALLETVRQAIVADPTLGGQVKAAYPYERRNNRNVNVAGIDLSIVDATIKVIL